MTIGYKEFMEALNMLNASVQEANPDNPLLNRDGPVSLGEILERVDEDFSKPNEASLMDVDKEGIREAIEEVMERNLALLAMPLPLSLLLMGLSAFQIGIICGRQEAARLMDTAGI